MRNLSLSGIVLCCSALVLPQLASAQRAQGYGTETRNWELTLSGTGSNDKNFDSGGFSASTSLGYFLTDHVEVGLRQDVNFNKSELTGSTTVAATRIGLDYHCMFRDGQRMVPFLGGKIGGVYGDGIREQFIAASEGGFKFYVTPRAFVLALAEYEFLFRDSDRADDAFNHGRFVYTLGFGFNW